MPRPWAGSEGNCGSNTALREWRTASEVDAVDPIRKVQLCSLFFLFLTNYYYQPPFCTLCMLFEKTRRVEAHDDAADSKVRLFVFICLAIFLFTSHQIFPSSLGSSNNHPPPRCIAANVTVGDELEPPSSSLTSETCSSSQ